MITIDMAEQYRKDCERGDHRFGYNAVDAGNGARPSGPQICLHCRRTYADILQSQRQAAVVEFAEKLKKQLGVDDPLLRNESWLTKEVGSEIDQLLASHGESSK